MRRFRVVIHAAVLVFCFYTHMYAKSQESKGNSPTPAMSSATYPDSQDGLKRFIEGMFGAMKSGDQKVTSLYLSNLTVPDHSTWFIAIFGPEEGRRLESKYGELLPQMPDKITKALKYAMEGGRTDVVITTLQKPVDPGARVGRAITEAMIQPIPLYIASGTSPSEKYSAYLGEFVYVDGAFRYIDSEVFQGLSTAPPPRIRISGDAALKSLDHKVAPIYPDETKANRTQGTVVLHVVIGTDGTIKEIEPVSGDTNLVKAATVAVQQWKYKPTLINAKPVEVDTTIKVDFHL